MHCHTVVLPRDRDGMRYQELEVGGGPQRLCQRFCDSDERSFGDACRQTLGLRSMTVNTGKELPAAVSHVS